MRMKIRQLCGNREVLSGSGVGSVLLRRLLEAVPKPTEPTVVFLDFGGIEAATGSFLREGPLEFRRVVRRPGSMIYPIIANAVEAVLEDLEVVLELMNDAVLICDLSESSVSNVRVVGNLEAKQALTFKALSEREEADAVSLAKSEAEALGSNPSAEGRGVGPTAWNNRLASLALKGIAIESMHGRAKRYRLAVQEGAAHGS